MCESGIPKFDSDFFDFSKDELKQIKKSIKDNINNERDTVAYAASIEVIKNVMVKAGLIAKNDLEIQCLEAQKNIYNEMLTVMKIVASGTDEVKIQGTIKEDLSQLNEIGIDILPLIEEIAAEKNAEIDAALEEIKKKDAPAAE
jgi:hypothetical protein